MLGLLALLAGGCDDSGTEPLDMGPAGGKADDTDARGDEIGSSNELKDAVDECQSIDGHVDRGACLRSVLERVAPPLTRQWADVDDQERATFDTLADAMVSQFDGEEAIVTNSILSLIDSQRGFDAWSEALGEVCAQRAFDIYKGIEDEQERQDAMVKAASACDAEAELGATYLVNGYYLGDDEGSSEPPQGRYVATLWPQCDASSPSFYQCAVDAHQELLDEAVFEVSSETRDAMDTARVPGAMVCLTLIGPGVARAVEDGSLHNDNPNLSDEEFLSAVLALGWMHCQAQVEGIMAVGMVTTEITG
jgi:hypothetical protein